MLRHTTDVECAYHHMRADIERPGDETMSTVDTIAAAYIAEWPCHSCIEDTAKHGLSDEDRGRIGEAYGDLADDIAAAIECRCRTVV